MDILAHGLWGGALSKAIKNKKPGLKLKFWQAAFWGMFPDLFAFTVPFLGLLFSIVTGRTHLSDFPTPKTPPAVANDRFPLFQLAATLYNYSHSFVMFGLVVLLLWLWKKKFYYVLLGWPLHILFDIPTHTAEFYPTPIFWPVSHWEFTHGFSWGEPWFMVLNYSLLIIVYVSLYRRDKKRAG
ncbi:MAG: hypothetical protein KW806_00575 [Candidatus Yanofskybacteria bacterium]|nr:hypothetical protein [Candidatus Yanofskybacteria bacterium]